MEEILPSNSLEIQLKMLSSTAFCKPQRKFNSDLKNAAHRIYVYFGMLLLFTYNMQHALFIYIEFDNFNHVVASLIVLLETALLFYKIITLNIKSKEIDEIIELMDDKYFRAKTDYDIMVLKSNGKEMITLVKISMAGLSLAGTSWLLAPLINLALGNDVVVPLYFPFDTNNSIGVTISALYESVLITWLGFGDLTFDCLIATFYSQIRAQIKMLRYDSENLVDKENGRYVLNEDIVHQRLKYLVNKYKKIILFKDRLKSIFNNCISMQLLVSAMMFCIVVYRMVTTKVIYAEFFNLAQYLLCLQIELFIFCYYGSQVKYESQFVVQSLFHSDWIKLSPKIRKEMTIAMARWLRPITIKVAYIVPLSLNTFFGVLRLSYSLYTLLKHT